MDELEARIARVLGREVRGLRLVERGYTHARRLLVELQDGKCVFAKVGSDDLTSGWLRAEHDFYRQAPGSFVPHLVAWDDHPENALLVLQDLSEATWPPPWTESRVELVLAALRELRGCEADVPSYADRIGREEPGWAEVARDPNPFLALGLCSAHWLVESLPALVAAEAEAQTGGDELCHFDVRSDNVCLVGDRALLVDWNHACRSNADLDLAFWLPSLASEGGPVPEQILPGRPELAAMVSGFFAARASLPAIPHAPRVREVQRSQLEHALPWVARCL